MTTGLLRERLLTVAPEVRQRVVQELPPAVAETLLYDWRFWARPEQLPPPDPWRIWVIQAGRGWGKTRTGAEYIKHRVLAFPGIRAAVVARTFEDARDVCVEGESGLLAILPPREVARWNRSLGELVLRNGSRVDLYPAVEPNRLRGPQQHVAWCDELASWRYREAWDNLLLGTRLGSDTRIIVTTTPRPTALYRSLLGLPGVVITRGSTFDNADHLDPTALASWRQQYAGTRLGRQELFGELLEDVPGALWRRDWFDDRRTPPALRRVVVAIDPAVTSLEGADETGIVVAGAGVDGRYYVLADLSCRASPTDWALRALAAYDRYHADRIVAETNNGGDLVETVLRTLRPAVPYRAVHASRGKQVRAEPIAALYEQGRVTHCEVFAELEDQLVSWTPDSGRSPDRLDALVWALTELQAPAAPIGVLVLDQAKRRGLT